MDIKVRRSIIDKWIDQNAPNGVAKLALESGVSTSLINKLRLGEAPKKEGMRVKIAEAIGVAADELFTIEKAS